MEVVFKVYGIEKVKKNLSDKALKEYPFAMARALTWTAQKIIKAEIVEMKRVFDRPTPYTLNSLYLWPAKKNTLVAAVELKDEGGKGTPAAKFLNPHIWGGDRGLKRHEKALQHVGVLPAGMYCVPGRSADLDAYGNMKASQIRQILSYFQAAKMREGYDANMLDVTKAKLKKGTKKKRGYEYFAIRRPGGSSRLSLGIYKRISRGGGIQPVIIFVKRPAYKVRFKFFEVAQRIADSILVREFEEALDWALNNPK